MLLLLQGCVRYVLTERVHLALVLSVSIYCLHCHAGHDPAPAINIVNYCQQQSSDDMNFASSDEEEEEDTEKGELEILESDSIIS